MFTVLPEVPFFLHESSSWNKLRLHTETQLPRYLGSGLDIGLGFGLSKRRTTKMLIREMADDQNARPQNDGRPKCSSAKRRTTKMLVRKTADNQNARPQNGGQPKCSSAKWQTTKKLVCKTADDQNALQQNGRRLKCSSASTLFFGMNHLVGLN